MLYFLMKYLEQSRKPAEAIIEKSAFHSNALCNTGSLGRSGKGATNSSWYSSPGHEPGHLQCSWGDEEQLHWAS